MRVGAITVIYVFSIAIQDGPFIIDAHGRYFDNTEMERFGWALKYEDIKLKD